MTAWTLAVSGYTAAETTAALLAPSATWQFKYERLAQDGSVLGELTTVEAGSGRVTFDANAIIRRTLALRMVDDGAFDWLREQIRPWAGLSMPDGGIAWWPCGVFIPATPPRVLRGQQIALTVNAYDRTQLLAAARVGTRYTVPLGQSPTNAVEALLEDVGIPFLARNLTLWQVGLPTTREWPLGTQRSQIVADLLRSAGYDPLWFDALGVAQGLPFLDWTLRPVSFTYRPDAASVMLPGLEQTADRWDVPNQIVGTVSLPDRTLLTSTATNSNPASPYSTVNRGLTLTEVVQSDALDQATLDSEVKRILLERSQVSDELRFTTGLMPFHGDADVLHVTYPALDIDDKYMELGWTLPLQAGAAMSHVCRRIVPI